MISLHDIVTQDPCYIARKRAALMTLACNKAFAPFGMRYTQWLTLLAVKELGIAGLTEIGEFFGLDRSTIKRNIIRLETSRHVEGVKGPDKRRALYKLTDKGEMWLKMGKHWWQEAMKAVEKM